MKRSEESIFKFARKSAKNIYNSDKFIFLNLCFRKTFFFLVKGNPDFQMPWNAFIHGN